MESIREQIKVASRLVGDISCIPRVSRLEANVFNAFAAAGVPFIIVGAVSDWPISGLKPNTLVERFAALRVRARVGDYVSTAFSAQRNDEEMSLAEYFSLLKSGFSGLPPYLGNQKLPELDALCRWPDYFKSHKDLKTWLGPGGTVTPLHCDYEDNLLAQIWGAKRFIVFPPHYAENLYLRQSNPRLFGSRFDPESPDFSQFPLARKIKGCQFAVNAGEILYLPAGWFHHVRALNFSLSSNMWKKGYPAVCRL